MRLVKWLKSLGKVPLKYCGFVYSLLRYNWRCALTVFFIFALLCYFFGFILTFLAFFSFFIYNLYQLCDQLLYNPECPKDSRTNVLTPRHYGMDNYESVFIKTEDNVDIHAIFLKRPSLEESLSSPTIIYLHGNAGNVGHRVSNAIEMLNRLKCNILLLEYRGYGASKGRPSERGLYEDAYAALKFLYSRNDICKSKIVLFGRSLGGAVAIGATYLMMTSSKWQHFLPSALVIENTFISIPDISRHLCAGRSQTWGARLFRLIPNWFYKNRYETLHKIANLTLPTLFISGLSDELIPAEMMTRLFNVSSARYKELHKFEGGSHNFTWRCTQYYPIFDKFLTKVFDSHFFPAEPPSPLADARIKSDECQLADEKSPLIASEEHSPPDISPPVANCVVMYHHALGVSSNQDRSTGSYELSAASQVHLLQVLDSGISPFGNFVTVDKKEYTDLVVI